jgi:hypothetical protein
MNLDRTMFLALTTTIAALSTAACTSDPGTATIADDIIHDDEEKAAKESMCLDNIEDAFPYEEGTCLDIAFRAQELQYEAMLKPGPDGITKAQEQACTPYSPENPNPHFTPHCDMFMFDQTYERCRAYARHFKADSAKQALTCLDGITKAYATAEINDCGYEALEASCYFGHPTVESTCDAIFTALEARGIEADEEEQEACLTLVSGLRDEPRAKLEALASGSKRWHGIYAALGIVLSEHE